MADFLHGKETYRIIGLCMEVHRELGFGFSEVVYKDAIQIEAEEQKVGVIREKQFDIYYKGKKIGHRFFADFVFFENIIAEIKSSSEGIALEHISQTLNYMRASNANLGLVINFGQRLEYKRLVL
jgi:GxxExxY protein